MQDVLKFLLIAVSAAMIGYVAWTLYGEGTRPAAARMSESVHMAQAQAQSMNQSLGDVGTIGEAGQPIVSRGTASSDMNTPVSVSVAEITSLDDLLAEWRLRYEIAKTSYTKFDASITNAKNRAAEYFAQQQALTEGMQDPNNRAKAQLEDEAEIALYRQWEARADAARKSAARIVIQLDDMDTNLRKMELRTGFVFDASAFAEVPAAVSELNQQIFDFQVASENIKLAADSPFKMQQP